MQWTSTCQGLPGDSKMWEAMKGARDAILAANNRKPDVDEEAQWTTAVTVAETLMAALGKEGTWRMQFSGSTDAASRSISIFVELTP